jgi:hypothetical protein
MKVQAGREVRWAFGGPQASSCEDANLAYNQGKPRCINQCSLSFILNISLCFTCLCIIKSIGIG